jgi:hypothetical protein
MWTEPTLFDDLDMGIAGPDTTSGISNPMSWRDAAKVAGMTDPDTTSGILGPATSQRHAWHRAGYLPTAAFDWSISQIDVTFDGTAVRQYKDIRTMLVDIYDRRGAYRFVCESTVSSYPVGERNNTIRMFHEYGHLLFFIPPKLTAAYRGRDPKPERDGDVQRRPDPRNRWGLNEAPPTTKTDAHDAVAIWSVAQGPTVPYLAKPDDCDASVRKHERRDLIRYAFWVEQKDGRTGVGGSLTIEAKRKLRGRPTTLDDSTLSALYFVMKHETNRDEIEAILGLSVAGYPSILRAYIHTNEGRKRADDLSAWRREIRRVRQILRDEGHVAMKAAA